MSEYPPERHGSDDAGATRPAPQAAPPGAGPTGPIPAPRRPPPWDGQQWPPPGQGWGSPQRPPAGPWPPQGQQWPPPQQWAPPGPWPPAPPKGGHQGLIIGLVIGLVVLLVAGGAGWYVFLGPGKAGTGVAASSSAPESAAPPSSAAPSGSRVGVPSGETPGTVPGGAVGPTTTAPQVLENAALATLNSLRADSLSRVTLDGRWVAQVASKSVGITDPLQTAQNGSHTFYATDILAESLRARQLVDSPSKVYVLWGTDFGKSSGAADGSPYWITLVDAGYASQDNVTRWCHVTYSQLPPQQLADTCAPRQLTLPHS